MVRSTIFSYQNDIMESPKINKNMYKNIPPVVTKSPPVYKIMHTNRKTKES